MITFFEIYQGIMIALTLSEDNYYCIYQSINRKDYRLVHRSSSKIYNIFPIDQGHAMFCADDGWFYTSDAGTTWFRIYCSNLFAPANAPIASVATILSKPIGWHIIAYGQDHKLYSLGYSPDVSDSAWSMDLDTTSIWTEKWYPALDGSPVGLLAGAGKYLLRADLDHSIEWQVINEVNGIIKSVVCSDKSNAPIFAIEVEKADAETSSIYWSRDMGDSLEPDLSRTWPATSVQSVYPTGEPERATQFVVFGRKSPESPLEYNIITK